MGLLTGTASFVSFDVLENLPEINLSDYLYEKIKSCSFNEIDDTFDEYSMGWVSVTNMFDSRFDYGAHMTGDYVTLSLRIDERKVPTAILNKFIDKEQRRVMAEKDLPKISRSLKAEIKARILTELTRKANPAPSVYDLSWNLYKKRVIFYSTDKRGQAVLEDVFRDTFGLTLRKRIPYTIAEARFSSISAIDMKSIKECSFI